MNAPWHRPAWRLLGLSTLITAALAVAGAADAQQSADPSVGGWQTSTRPAVAGDTRSSGTTQSKTPKPKRNSAKSAKGGNSSAAPAGKPDAAASQQQVEAGINALGAGKYADATGTITLAIESGNLPSSQTARALYYRGVAYRKDNKPAQAITDLTRALWLRNGLDSKLRTDALRQRSAAYREAGLPDQTEQVAARSSSAGTTTQAAPTGGIGSMFSSLFGGGESVKSSTGSIAEEAKPKQISRPAVAVRSSSMVVSAPSPTASVAPAAGKSWSTVTKVTVAKPPPATASRVASVASTPAKRPTAALKRPAVGAPTLKLSPASAGGRYGVQVAAVRNSQDAQQVVARIQQRYGASLGGRAPLVEQTVAGNMGTIYRVRIGPFATANDSESVCARLKGDGMTCLVVRR